MGKHFVPQEYLRGFSSATDRRNVWMLDKEYRRWSHPAIKRVAQSRDFYSEADERRLANEVEALGHDALSTLRDGRRLREDQRDALAYYMAVFVMRGPRKRRKGWEILPSSLDDTLENVRSGLEALRSQDNSQKVDSMLREVDQIEVRYRQQPPAEVIDQIRSPWPSRALVDSIRRMVWRICRVPLGEKLFTNDSPVFFFDSLGLGRTESELTFPVSPSLVLLGSHQGDPGSTIYLRGTMGLSREVKRRMSWGAERFVFASEKSVRIDYLAARKRGRLKKLRW